MNKKSWLKQGKVLAIAICLVLSCVHTPYVHASEHKSEGEGINLTVRDGKIYQKDGVEPFLNLDQVKEVISNQTHIIARQETMIQAFDATTKAEVWRYEIKDTLLISSLFLKSNTVFMIGKDLSTEASSLWLLNVIDGTQIAEKDITGYELDNAEISIENQNVIIKGKDSIVISLDSLHMELLKSDNIEDTSSIDRSLMNAEVKNTPLQSNIILPQYDPYWYQYGGNNTTNFTVDSKVATKLEDLKQKAVIDGQLYEPIIVGNYLYTITNQKYLVAYDQNGTEIKRASLSSETGMSFFCARLAYGDGKIFVTLSDRIQAFDIDTFESLWLTPENPGKQMISTITYHNGYVYSGVTSGGGGGQGATNGFFFAVPTEDQDTTSSNEVNNYAWKTASTTSSGYYWAGAAISNNAVIFAGDDGQLISHHLTKDEEYDRYDLGATKVRSNITYLEKEQAILVGTQDTNKVYKIKLNKDNSFNRSSIIESEKLKGGVTAGMSSYNGRLYVPSGGQYGGGFSVLDEQTLRIIYDTQEIGTQSVPLITTAYASEENGQQVYIYLLENSGHLVLMKDKQGQDEMEYERLKNISDSGNSNSVLADINGNIYIYTGWKKKKIVIYENSLGSAYDAEDMKHAINRLPASTMNRTTDILGYHSKQQVEYTNLRYENLSDAEKAKIAPEIVAKLSTITDEMGNIVSTKVEDINARIQRLPENLVANDVSEIESLWNEYGILAESDKAKVNNVAKLKKALEDVYELQASIENLTKEIDNINLETLTLGNSAEINSLKSKYDNLSAKDKESILNYDKLNSALDKLKMLRDQLAVGGIIKSIDNLPEIKRITLADEKAITEVYRTYDALHKEVKKEISNVGVLLQVYKEVTTQRETVTKLNDDIWEKLDPTNITLKDEVNIKDFEVRYAALSDTNKTYIKYYADVKQARIIIESLQKGIIPSVIFEGIQGTKKSYSYEGKMNNHTYAFTFQGESISDARDFKVGLSSDSTYTKQILEVYPNAYILDMSEKGALPGPVTLRMELPVVDGSYPLYTYDTATKKANVVQEITVKDGIANFVLTKGATYFVDFPKTITIPGVDNVDKPEVKPNDTPATYDTTNITGYVLLGIVSFAGVCLISRRHFLAKKR